MKKQNGFEIVIFHFVKPDVLFTSPKYKFGSREGSLLSYVPFKWLVHWWLVLGLKTNITMIRFSLSCHGYLTCPCVNIE